MKLDDLLASTETDERGCLLWTGGLSEGYAAASIDGTWHRLHRYVLALVSGADQPDLLALHSCPGGGQRRCINPIHLYWGTHSDNLRDSIVAGTFRSPWAWTDTTCGNGHDLTLPGMVVARTDGGRRCGECQREAKRRWKRKHREAMLADVDRDV